MKIAVFGGSFDPVHVEHIRLAEAAIEELGLDKLFVMPAHTPPHKKGKTLSADADRLELCRLAFEDIEKVEVSDYEIAQGGTSYTYLTCRHFKAEYPTQRFFGLSGRICYGISPLGGTPRIFCKTLLLPFAAGRRRTTLGWRKNKVNFSINSA